MPEIFPKSALLSFARSAMRLYSIPWAERQKTLY